MDAGWSICRSAKGTTSCGGRNRTCAQAVNSRLPVPTRDPPHQQVRTAGFEPAISCARDHPAGGARRNPRLSHVLKDERPAGIEPALPPWQGSRLPLHHGRLSVTTKLSTSESTGPDSNRRHRITGAESWPLDDQCLCFSRTGPIRLRRIGARLEPSPARLRAATRHTAQSRAAVCPAAANTLVLCLVGAVGVEPTTRVL